MKIEFLYINEKKACYLGDMIAWLYSKGHSDIGRELASKAGRAFKELDNPKETMKNA